MNINNIAFMVRQNSIACEAFSEGVVIGTVVGILGDSYSVTTGAKVTLLNPAAIYKADSDEYVVGG